MTRLLAVMAVLMAVGCGDRDDWYAPPELLPIAQEAALEWCRASHGEYCPVIYDVPQEGRGVMRSVSVDMSRMVHAMYGRDHVSCGWYLGPDGLAVAGSSGKSISVVPEMHQDGGGCWSGNFRDSLRATIAHELGHAGGLDHTDHGIMVDSFVPVHVTESDWR